MLLSRIFRLTAALILTGAAACDNVAWGGVELRIEAPPSTAPASPDATAEEPPPPPPLELGPILFVVDRGESFDPAAAEARLLPVASLEPGGLAPVPTPDRVPDVTERLRTERMSDGSRFVLFSGGRRVGSFIAGEGGSVDRRFCAPRPSADGRIEVVPGAAAVDRFLALPEEQAEGRPYRTFERVESTLAQREATLSMAAAIFVTREIRWPPSVSRARADVRAFVPTPSEPVVAATFLYGDSLAVGEAPPNAYSLFFLGEEDATGSYEPAYVRYREVGVHGKEATRAVDHLDWDGDGRDEVLLEIFGTTGRWFAGLTRGDAGWEESFDEGCPSVRSEGEIARAPESALPGGARADSDD